MTKAEKWEEAILNDSFGATFFSIEFPNKNGYTHAIKELGGEIGVTFSQVSEDKQRFFLDHFEKKFAK